MVTGREQSDDRVVPEGGRKLVPTGAKRLGGKAVTANERMGQLRLNFATADNPQGNAAGGGTGLPAPPVTTEPKAKVIPGRVPSAMKKMMQDVKEKMMEAIASDENLREAFKRVAANKGAPGPNRQSIVEVAEHLDSLLPQLSQGLLAGSYRPGMIRRVWIPKSGGGQRGLGIPDVVDRLVQQAVLQVLSPLYEPTFHGSSHGFRPGRSCHTAIAEAKKHVESGLEWVVDIDLEKFFDRVPHQRLLARLGERIKDRRVVLLIHHMLKAKVVLPNGVIVLSEEGTPQGGPMSPLLSNIVLDELDHELSRRGHRFVRYADDCNIYVGSERAGQRVMDSIRGFIESRLRLKVNESKSAVANPADRHFLGFCVCSKRKGPKGYAEIKLSERSRRNLGAKIRTLIPRNLGESLAASIKRLNVYLRGWMGFFGFCTWQESGVFAAADAHIRRRLRASLLRHWKRKRTIDSRLCQRGASDRAAWQGVYQQHNSWWALSHCPAVDRALDNRFFASQGLLSLSNLFRERRASSRRPTRTAPGRIVAGSNPSLEYGGSPARP